MNQITSIYYDLQQYKEAFENLRMELKRINIRSDIFDSVKILLVDVSKAKVDESLEIRRSSTSEVADKANRILKTDSSQKISDWMERFITSFLNLEDLLLNYYILDNLGEIKVRKPSKYISEALNVQKPETMLNRVLKGITILLRYDEYILKTEYKEIQHKKARKKRAEIKLVEEKKPTPLQKIKQLLMKYKIFSCCI